MEPILIQTKKLTKSYHMGEQVLHGVDLTVKRHEVLAVMGQSGSGKSTLMNILGMLDRADGGEYWFEGQPVYQFNQDQLAAIRNREIGFVFQAFFLLPRMTALENVALPLLYRNVPDEERRERAMAMLEKVGMGNFAHRKPNELSGGQQQRVAIARALVGEPALVLADEPTGSLDAHIGQEVLDFFVRMNEDSGTTLIIITHDAKVAKACHRQVKMVDGLIH